MRTMKLKYQTLRVVLGLALGVAVVGCDSRKSFKGLEEEAALTGQGASQRPVLSGVKDQKVFAGALFRLDLNNAKSDSDTGMTYVCEVLAPEQDVTGPCQNLPSEPAAAFDTTTGELSWTPPLASLGFYNFTFAGKDSFGTDTRRVQLEVVPDTRPLLTKVPAQIIERGQQLLIDLNDTRSGGDEGMSYKCTFDRVQDGKVADGAENCQLLPGEPAIKFDTGSGALAWIPGKDAEEAYEIKVTGRNETGDDTLVFFVTVIEPRGDTIRLTTIRDQYVTSPKSIFIDVDNQLTGDDAGVSYSCIYDESVDGKVDNGTTCNSLPGIASAKFDTRKGIFTWQPPVDRTNVEIKVRGEKNGSFDEKVFVVIFGGDGFGEIGNSALEFDPPSFDFGHVEVGKESPIKQVNVVNVSSVEVFLQAPLAGNENFQVAYSTCPASPAPLAPSVSCVVGVKFAPGVPAGLGTTVLLNFGASTSNTAQYNSAFSLTGVGAGSLVFSGLNTITDVTHNSLKLNWDETPDAVTYIVFRVNGSSLEFIETILNIGGTAKESAYNGLTPGTSYTYRVRATDVFGVHDGNTKDVTVTTLANTSPVLANVAAPAVYTGRPIALLNWNDTNTGNDKDSDGDTINYSCRFDTSINGSVSAFAPLCTTILNEDGTNVAFNTATGELSNWIPRYVDENGNFEFRITGSDPYGGNDIKIIGVTVQSGYPTLTTVADKLLPNNALEAGTTLSLDIDNVRFVPTTDQFMDYECNFVRYETTGPTVAAPCSSLPGVAASFVTSTGAFSWQTNDTSIGAYTLTFDGQNGAGSDTKVAKIIVSKSYTTTDLLVDLNAGHAAAFGPGVNGGGFTGRWYDLATATNIGELHSMATGAWTGTGTPADPYALTFDGVDDYVSVSNGIPARGEFILEGWVKPDPTVKYRQILASNGDNNGRGITLTSSRIATGNGFSRYEPEVMADSPSLYWRFDNVVGAVVYDHSPNGVNGTISFNGATGVQGIGPLVDLYDKAFYTTGSGRITVGNYTLGTDWTMESWFYYPFPGNCSNATEGCTFARSSTNDRPIFVNSALKLGAFKGVGGVSYDSGFDMTTLATGWHHMAAVATGGTSTTYYIDGTSVGSIAWAATSNINTVGNRNNVYGAIGKFDEFAFYPTSLSGARIAAHYQAGTARDFCDFLRLPPRIWHHVAAKADSASGKLTAVIDGDDVCVASLVKTPDVSGTTGNLELGGGSAAAAANSGFSGQLAEVRAYGSANGSIITDNFAARGSRYTPKMPIPIKGLRLWIVGGQEMYQDAAGTTPAADGTPVSLWRDLSGDDNDLGLAVSPTAPPVYRAGVINGHDAVEFDGATGVESQRLSMAKNIGQVATVFAVARSLGTPRGRLISSTSNNSFYGFHGGYRNRFYANSTWVFQGNSPIVDGQWEMFMFDVDLANYARGFLNGAFAGAATNAAFQGPNGITIGSSYNGSEGSYSQVAAVIVYNRLLSNDERLRVEAYLNDLYNIF